MLPVTTPSARPCPLSPLHLAPLDPLKPRTSHSVSAMAREGRRSPGTVPGPTRHTPRQRTRCLGGGKAGQRPCSCVGTQ